LRPWYEHLALRAWSWLALHPALYGMSAKIGARALKAMGGRAGRIARLPFAGGWTDGRDMPAPEGRTFRELYAERNGDRA
jgi:L-lactate utilization protein LutB